MAYYLPISSTSLAHYFACACVKPAIYFDNKPQDIQDSFPNTLLLSTKLGNKNADCCLELVLTDHEEKLLQPCGNDFRFFPIPLPISRVKKVYFKDQRQLNQTLSNINLSAAFVPASLAEVKRFSNVQFNRDKITGEIIDRDYSDKVVLFDRVLGALALMKTAKEPYMNYSENYASTLSFFNVRVKEDLHKQGHEINVKFFDLFTRSGKFINAIPYLERKLTREDINQIAAEYKQTIERSFTGLINFEKLSGITYAFAILQTYGVGGEAASKKIDGLIANNFQDLKEGTEEGIALYYGYNRGYSVFNNSYGISEDKKQSVKFLLDSQLDYYAIESVYQYVFYSNNSAASYPYIDSWCPKKSKSIKRKTEYRILDTVFVGKKKPSVFSKEYLHGLLEEIKRLDVFNMTLCALIDSVRNRVANDARDEFEDAADTRISEINEKWSARFLEGSAAMESLKEDLKYQCQLNAELQKKNDELVEQIEILKSTLLNPSTDQESEADMGEESVTKDETSDEIGENEVASDEESSVGIQDDITTSSDTTRDGVLPFDQ